jgi:hypothetical protein
MTDVAISATIRSKRIYHFETPYHIPRFFVGLAIRNLKQLGVWEKLPPPVRKRAKAAHASWSSFTITEKDLDSVPDHDWKFIAAKMRLKWEPTRTSSVNDPHAVRSSFPNQLVSVEA